MSSEQLRRAAWCLREHARLASPGPWNSAGNKDETSIDNDLGHIVAETHRCAEHPNLHPYDADYIALMHPPVALALAEWLDQAARHVDARIEAEQHVGIPADTIKQDDERRAEDVARAILREGAIDATP